MKNKVYMRWSSAEFNQAQKFFSGRVIIDQIHPKPKKVVFRNESDKIASTTQDSRFPHTAWQDLIYVVDVEIYHLEDAIKAYTVTKLYNEDTFDPTQEE